jgi:hypothetical protein
LKFVIRYAYPVNDRVLFLLIISNKSRLPISITSGVLFDQDGQRAKIGFTRHSTLSSNVQGVSNKQYPLVFPINLDSLASKIIFVESESPLEITGHNIRGKFGTNRGMVTAHIQVLEKTQDLNEMLRAVR